jgi:hypothetical protein
MERRKGRGRLRGRKSREGDIEEDEKEEGRRK